jgi:hypothetical protein
MIVVRLIQISSGWTWIRLVILNILFDLSLWIAWHHLSRWWRSCLWWVRILLFYSSTYSHCCTCSIHGYLVHTHCFLHNVRSILVLFFVRTNWRATQVDFRGMFAYDFLMEEPIR